MYYSRILFAFLLLAGSVSAIWGQDYRPEKPLATLTTRWAAQVSPDNVWQEYPRPQMVRPDWINLNGNWQYAIRPRDEAQPQTFEGQILVPFPIESSLSGVNRWVGIDNHLWYKTTFRKPRLDNQRLLLHFGAVDWHATVYLNGKEVGQHIGGYDPFSFDITDFLSGGRNQELVVKVWDPTDSGMQARGKQVNEPRGIWYTAVTGIWQTVWLEPVPELHIQRLRITPDLDRSQVHIQTSLNRDFNGQTLSVSVSDGEKTVASDEQVVMTRDTITLTLPLEDVRAWSPEDPFLYDVQISVSADGTPIDEVRAYFGMRKISLGKDENGFTRILLNNQPYFQYGPLDQGWWPDGLYTPPTDEAMKYDLEVTRDLGFNMLRKHVKVESARFYYHCDQMGLLVWQDMPSAFPEGGDLFVGPFRTNDASRPAASARQFEREWKGVMDYLHNHPSIVVWVPFNEGWGQYETQRISAWTQAYDPSRLVNPTSGWTDRGVGHMFDAHQYPGPSIQQVPPNRATVLGEFGGLGWPIEKHLWWNKRNWGYRTYFTQDELHTHYVRLLNGVQGLIGFGLSAAIYTQTTDVEGEVNGLMTYDRELVKFDSRVTRQLAQGLYEKWEKNTVILPSSEYQPQLWHYTFDKPAEGWTGPDYDASGWSKGNGPFSNFDNQAIPEGTSWSGRNLYLIRRFTLDKVPGDLRAMLHTPGSSITLYLNGEKMTELTDGQGGRHYTHIPLGEFAGMLKAGENVLAIEVEGVGERRSFDFGLYASKRKN